MELRKHPEKELDRKRPLFFGIGLVIALSSTMIAFEWKFTGETAGPKDLDPRQKAEEIINEPILLRPEPKPQPSKPQPAEPEMPKPSASIEIVADDLPDIIIDPVVPDQLDNEINNIDVAAPSEEDVSNEPVPYAEKMPQFPGGEKAFLQYLGKNTRYTRLAQRMEIEGQVVVSFVVERDGSLTDIKVIKGLGAGLDEEAVRVLENSPGWEPGRQGGHDLRVRMMVPIRFKLNR
ncbi:energy transducer TonB [Roseivirga sp. BDSF3-8]|uniref:energy transducer TonB n=1 Tax=Roseivirga sp. BDSF3-8 TaxID=3241598 RepID=UPI003531C8EF